jgi:putative transposase
MDGDVTANSVPHRRAIRLPWHDYASAGAYFVTLCTARRALLLGHVDGDRMLLSPLGRLVVGEWLASSELRSEIELDRFVVMPNHLHAIVWIVRAEIAEEVPGADLPVAPTTAPGPAPRSLASLIAGFKAAVTRGARGLKSDPTLEVWQRGYYERVIRDEPELERTRGYIALNPECWPDDPDNPLAPHRPAS